MCRSDEGKKAVNAVTFLGRLPTPDKLKGTDAASGMDISPLCLSSSALSLWLWITFCRRTKYAKIWSKYAEDKCMRTREYFCPHSWTKATTSCVSPRHCGRTTCDIFQGFVWIPVKNFWYVNNELMTLGHRVVVTSLILLALLWSSLKGRGFKTDFGGDEDIGVFLNDVKIFSIWIFYFSSELGLSARLAQPD